MIYNVILDKSKNIDSFDWKIEDGFVSSKGMDQRIRLDSNLAENFSVEKAESDVIGNMHLAGFKIPNCRFVCNNKTLNPILMKSNRSEDESDNIIIYILVHKDFKMVTYNITSGIKVLRNVRVMDRDTRRPRYTGYTLVMSKKDLVENNTLVVRMNFVDTSAKYAVSTYSLNLVNNNLEILCENENQNKDFAERMRKLAKNQKRSLIPPLRVNPDMILTYVLVCPESMKAKGEEIMARLKKHLLITVPDNEVENSEVINKLLAQPIEELHVRALSTLGMNIPVDVKRQNKLLYTFRYNEETRCFVIG